MKSPWKKFLDDVNWHRSDSYSGTKSDFGNTEKHCVDAISKFSELQIDYQIDD